MAEWTSGRGHVAHVDCRAASLLGGFPGTAGEKYGPAGNSWAIFEVYLDAVPANSAPFGTRP